MIVGTAGHIDHGKTALVKALTGVDADRLAEEQARGISIDLGFAYLPTADGEVLGFVDVPGHERFMRNMLAGAAGIDFALLVVAADDGIMPQTREHLAVVELLGIERGLVALTKCDLADPERQAALEREIRSLLASGSLHDAPILAVSAHTGEGITALRDLLEAEASAFQPRHSQGRFRLAIDRSFSLHGTGTVVTGTVAAGQIRPGDALMLSPSGRPVRVRSLHAQIRPAELASEGMRCGVNLAAVDARTIQRGDVLLDPVLHAPTARIDVHLRLLPAETRPLRHWTPVRLHHGTAEIGCRIALLQNEPLAPGDEALIQLILDAPIAASVRDRFVVRDTSANRTIGGGHFVDLRAPARRRRAPHRLAQLAALDHADPAEALAAQLTALPGWLDWPAFTRDRGLGCDEAQALLATVLHESVGPFLFGPTTFDTTAAQITAVLSAFHQRYPQLLGMGATRVLAALEPRLAQGIGQALLSELAQRGALAEENAVYRLPDHQLGLDRADQRIWEAAWPQLAGDHRFQPPRLAELALILSLREFELRRVLKAKAQQGALSEVVPDLFLLRETMGEIAGIVAEIAETALDGEFAAAALRDRLDGGRKVAIQVLEYFDRSGITLRRGDLRIIDPTRLTRYRNDRGKEATLVGRQDFKSK